MEMIDAYIHAVVKYLPRSSREDIAEELRGLIEEQKENSTMRIEEILESFGDPKILAEQYSGRKRSLIGPALYDGYLTILKIVIPAVLLGLFVSQLVAYFSDEQIGILEIILGMFQAALYTFAYITIAFMIAGHFMDKSDVVEEDWNIGMLKIPNVEEKKVSTVEGIFGMILTSVFLVLLHFSLDFFAIYSFSTGSKVVLLNVENFEMFLWMLSFAFLCSFAMYAMMIVFDRANKPYTYMKLVLNIISTILVVIVITHPNLLNPNLNAELLEMGLFETTNFSNLIRLILQIVGAILVIVLIVESVRDLYAIYGKEIVPVFRFKKKE